MKIIAHRGASAYYAQNTLDAFKAVVNLGGLFLETDVQRSKDGVLVLHHDYKLSNGKFIKDCNVDYLKQFDIPAVSELLAVVPPTTGINFEIKNDDNIYPGIEKNLFKILNARKFARKARVLISSFDYPSLQRVRALDSKIKIGVLTRNFDINKAVLLNAFSVNISAQRVTKQVVLACHAKKIKVLVYTVNTYKEAMRIKELGVDAIFSNYPEILDAQFVNLGLTI